MRDKFQGRQLDLRRSLQMKDTWRRMRPSSVFLPSQCPSGQKQDEAELRSRWAWRELTAVDATYSRPRKLPFFHFQHAVPRAHSGFLGRKLLGLPSWNSSDHQPPTQKWADEHSQSQHCILSDQWRAVRLARDPQGPIGVLLGLGL